MTRSAIRSEEAIGLVAAVAVHVGLVWVLMTRPAPQPLLPPVEKMTVTLSDDVGLTSTSPEPSAQAAPDEAPVLGEPPAPEPEPAPVRKVEPPRPEPVRPVPPKPVVKASPVPRASAAPRPSASARPDPIGSLARRTPQAQPAKTGQKASPAPRPSASASPRAQAGGSRIGNDFLRGVPGARASGPAQAAPAAAIGPAVRSALAGEISRRLKPRWAAPQGIDADKLVTFLTWNLNRDGTLAGAPRVIRQDGINEANRAQAQRHAEQAVRAVQLAAPFTLPPEYYDAWKRVAEFRFDKRLAQ